MARSDKRKGAHAHRGPPATAARRCARIADRTTGDKPVRRPLEVNDTRLNAKEWEVGYPIARDVSAQARER